MLIVGRTIAGKPTPRVYWYANEREVAGRVNASADVDVVTNKILVPQLRREHLNTTYTCLATNTNLTAKLEKSVLLNVHRECGTFRNLLVVHRRQGCSRVFEQPCIVPLFSSIAGLVGFLVEPSFSRF